jgi:hypothetical protein
VVLLFIPQTVRNYLHSASFGSMKICKKPFISEKNKGIRLDLARKWSCIPSRGWEEVIFSDECKFELWRPAGPSRVWRQPGTRYEEKNLQPTMKHSTSVMAWGSMAASGTGNLVFIDGTMDKYAYVRILSENLMASVEKLGIFPFVFQQDNDPKHTSGHAREYFKSNGIMVLQWPSQSPDLNPIEYLWAFMKVKVAEKRPRNISELKQVLVTVWNEITPEITRNLVHSMPRRIEAVLRAKGGNTKY